MTLLNKLEELEKHLNECRETYNFIKEIKKEEIKNQEKRLQNKELQETK